MPSPGRFAELGCRICGQEPASALANAAEVLEQVVDIDLG